MRSTGSRYFVLDFFCQTGNSWWLTLLCHLCGTRNALCDLSLLVVPWIVGIWLLINHDAFNILLRGVNDPYFFFFRSQLVFAGRKGFCVWSTPWMLLLCFSVVPLQRAQHFSLTVLQLLGFRSKPWASPEQN